MVTEPTVNRERLGFPDAVEVAFRFLEDRGFRCVSELSTFVRFEHDEVFVNVFHGRSSYELGVEVGHRALVHDNLVEEKFALSDLVSISDPAMTLPGFAAVTSEQVKKFVPQLAKLTERFGGSMLNGDLAAFTALRLDTAARSEAMREGWRASQLRERADLAWQDKDFGRVVDAYGEMASELRTVGLRPSELARLKYAESKLPGDGSETGSQ